MDLYVSSDLQPIVNFIHGFHAACNALGFPGGYDATYQQIAVERGWKWAATGFEDQMVEQRLDYNDVAQELLTIEIEAWKRRKVKI